MPANLTQQYRKAEQAYRQAASASDELQCLQTMFRELPKHKGTDKLQAELKQKISQAKAALEAQASSPKNSLNVRIPRQGAGRVILLGGPNSGKSQFVRATTRAEPEVAEYPFTTRVPDPAMMPFEDVTIQLIDLPPVTRDLLDPASVGLIRGGDLVLLFVDLSHDEGWEQCQEVLDQFQSSKTRLGQQTYLDETDIGRTYTATFLVLNKCDAEESDLRWELFQESPIPDLETFQISSVTGDGVPHLQAAIFEKLDVVRVYTKSPKDKQPDYTHPFTIHRGGTVGELAAMVHKDFAQGLKSARVWGSAVHDGTTVKADYVVHDKDVVELHL